MAEESSLSFSVPQHEPGAVEEEIAAAPAVDVAPLQSPVKRKAEGSLSLSTPSLTAVEGTPISHSPGARTSSPGGASDYERCVLRLLLLLLMLLLPGY